MSPRPTLDSSSFERLLAAAWVLQHQHEQEARNRRPASDEKLAEPPEAHVGPHCASELDVTRTRLWSALGKLREAAEAAVNQNTGLTRATTINGIEQVILLPDEKLAEPPEAHVELHCASELDTTNTRLLAALSKLREAAEAAVNQNTARARAATLNGIEQVILPRDGQAAHQERDPHVSSFRLLTSERGAWSVPTPARVDASRSRVLPDATEQTRTARQIIGTLTAAGAEETAAAKSKEIPGLTILESFITARRSAVSWPMVREPWKLRTAPAAHAKLFSELIAIFRLPRSALRDTDKRLLTESACRYLSEAQSSFLNALRSASQEFRGANTYRPLSGLSKGALGQSLRRALLSLLNVAENAKNRLESFARYRVKVRVTLGPRRAMAAGGALLLLLLIMVAFTLLQVWHHEHFYVVAATSIMNHQSEENAVRKVEQFRPIPPVRVSHMQVSDRGVLSVVEALSRYEIRELRRQADYGDDSAAFIMGMVYETGHYVPQSCTKAADWVARSANGGNAAAQYNLGLRYRDGDGLPANDDEAEKWLRKAADQGYSDAKLALETLTSRDAHLTYAP